jgi:diadenylate cyclase
MNLDLSTLSTHWLDWLAAAFDFTLVYLLIYQTLLLIRGTRAVQVLVGLVAIIVAWFLSRDDYFELPTVHWLLDKFFSAIILVVVVLFQQDLRRGLSKFAGRGWLAGVEETLESARIDELLKALHMLRSAGLGGLIVVERGADLTSATTDGTRLDALLTKELLFAIFNPAHANPLHDGAVIVRGDRILAAACFLPLTSNEAIERSLGTRHRAAIGVTEDNDSVAIIVSESSRAVSLAVNGQLSRPLEPGELREALQRLIGRGARPGDYTPPAREHATGPVRVAGDLAGPAAAVATPEGR